MGSYFLHLKLLLKKLGIAFLIFSLCRILFYLFNANHFSDVSFSIFLWGIRFDWVAISFLFAPLVILHLAPFSFRNFSSYNKLLTVVFYMSNTLAIVLNLIDVAYFDFTLKRTTSDFFGMIGTGDDFFKLLPHYIIDFWYDYILLILLLFLSWWLHKKWCQNSAKFYPFGKRDYWTHSVIFVSFSTFTVLGMRGGFQYKPIDIVNAGQYAEAQNIPIVLNTPFTVIKTLFVDNIVPVIYFPDNELETIYSPERTISGSGIFKNKNVVLIIMESFAKEYVGGFNNGNGYTPFLDSLMKESYVFTNAYANGQKSIESLPCILSGLPQLMNSSYVLSNYAGNKLNGLPKSLRDAGYNTSFYHGGANGTMGFNGFVGVVGVDQYYGLNEYPQTQKDKDYDGLWGIFDEPYLQYYAGELNKKEEPFFSTIFTLSSHHPYQIPKTHQNEFPKGTLPIHESIGYTDYSLKQFFNTARQMAWFNNTVFVFTPDHSSHSNSAYYNTSIGRFAIPVFIYDPTGSLKGKNQDYFQQIDIMPTLLGLTGINQSIITFGNNAFSKTEKYAINYTNNCYQLAYHDRFLIFDGEKTVGFYNTKKDSLLTDNLINNISPAENKLLHQSEKLIKAIIQQYNTRLLNNQLAANE